MSLRDIRTVPDPVLKEKCKKVSHIDGSVAKLVADMIETMQSASGVGLAAPQVGVPLRIAVIQVPDRDVIVLINPQIIKREGERTLEEGCLSIPGYMGETNRSESVKVKALDINGKEFRLKASSDLLAQAIEHEVDHLDGILYIDHLSTPNKFWKLEPEDETVETKT